MTGKKLLLLTPAVFLSTALLLTTCGGSSIDCGEGTQEQDGVCIPVYTVCSPGTKFENGHCIAELTCGEGTHLDEDRGECVPNADADAGADANVPEEAGAETDADADAGADADVPEPAECWTDPATQLTWQAEQAPGYIDWDAAVAYCGDLDLCGLTDWELPTISELRSIIRGCPATETGGACGVTDACTNGVSCWSKECTGCMPGAGSVNGCYWPASFSGACYWYWSSTWAWSSGPSTNAWSVGFFDAFMNHFERVLPRAVRCVLHGS